MNQDHKESGKCSFTMTKKLQTGNNRLGLALKKTSPYTDSVNIGYMFKLSRNILFDIALTV